MHFDRTPAETAISERRATIAKRRDELTRERDGLLRELDRLTKEDDELQVALRVLVRLTSASSDAPSVPDGDDNDSNDNDNDGAANRPVGIPTTRDMILSVLGDDARRNGRGLELQEVIEAVRVRWWPNVTSSNIRPTLWRMHSRENIVIRIGTRHRIAPHLVDQPSGHYNPHENEAATA